MYFVLFSIVMSRIFRFPCLSDVNGIFLGYTSTIVHVPSIVVHLVAGRRVASSRKGLNACKRGFQPSGSGNREKGFEMRAPDFLFIRIPFFYYWTYRLFHGVRAITSEICWRPKTGCASTWNYNTRIRNTWRLQDENVIMARRLSELVLKPRQHLRDNQIGLSPIKAGCHRINRKLR